MTPFTLIIFGATGDLMRKKLTPAFYDLYTDGFLPDNFRIIGFSRREIKKDQFIALLEEAVSKKKNFKKRLFEEFSRKIVYKKGTFEDKNSYLDLKKEIKPKTNLMLYLATPPQFYETILDNIYASGLYFAFDSSRHWVKLLIEKPFGKDLETAILLDRKLEKLFQEEQIYRIDHYLGKETVQNILAFRFANGIFEPIWNNRYLDHVQITLAEKEGVSGRVSFYEGVGALRDVSQNHLLQLLAMVTMEQPRTFSASGVREEREKAIKAISCINPSEVEKYTVRGQYQSYLQEKGVNRNSKTETFVAMKLFVDTPRFKGVPFYLRSGKKLAEDVVEISLVFKQVCHLLFREVGCPEEGNVLTIRIQPEEGISVRFIGKKPGLTMKLTPINMDFSYREAFTTKEVDAYERILKDAFSGDQMLFNSSFELIYSWRFIAKIMEGWKTGRDSLYTYKEGSWGPKQALDLIEKDGKKWLIK